MVITNWIKQLKLLGGHFDLDAKIKRRKELESITNEPDFWSNQGYANNVNKELANLSKIIDEYNSIIGSIKNSLELIELIKMENDLELIEGLEKDLIRNKILKRGLLNLSFCNSPRYYDRIILL